MSLKESQQTDNWFVYTCICHYLFVSSSMWQSISLLQAKLTQLKSYFHYGCVATDLQEQYPKAT